MPFSSREKQGFILGAVNTVLAPLSAGKKALR